LYVGYLSDADSNITLPIRETTSGQGGQVRTWAVLPVNLCGGLADVEITTTAATYTWNAYGIQTGEGAVLPLVYDPYYTVLDIGANEILLRVFLQEGTLKLADGPNVIYKITVGEPAERVVVGPSPH